MIQFKDKKIIILTITFLLLLALIIFFLINRDKKATLTKEPVNVNTSARPMTTKEKEMVGLDKNQKATVINDQEGFFIYNVVK